MSTPIATPADLATFLGETGIDDARATQVLAIAQSFCEDIVTPLPASAFGIVLAAAARTYTNPQSLTQEVTGSFVVARQAGSVSLTKSERATLVRAAGRGGAASVSVLDAATVAADLPPWDYDSVDYTAG